MVAQAERFAQGEGEERQRMMFGVASEEQTALALPIHFLRQREAELITIERLGRRHVDAKQAHGSEPDDLEGAREQDAFDIVGRRQIVDMAIASGRIDTSGSCLFNFLILGNLRQFGRLVEAAIVHAARLAVTVPTDLLYA